MFSPFGQLFNTSNLSLYRSFVQLIRLVFISITYRMISQMARINKLMASVLLGQSHKIKREGVCFFSAVEIQAIPIHPILSDTIQDFPQFLEKVRRLRLSENIFCHSGTRCGRQGRVLRYIYLNIQNYQKQLVNTLILKNKIYYHKIR